MTNPNADTKAEPSATMRLLSGLGGALIGLFAAGFLVGYAKIMVQHGMPGLKDIAILAAGLGLLALAYLLLRKSIGRPRIA